MLRDDGQVRCPGAVRRQRLQMAGQSPTPRKFERRLDDAQSSPRHDWLLRIVEPPLRAGDRSAVVDPLSTLGGAGSGH